MAKVPIADLLFCDYFGSNPIIKVGTEIGKIVKYLLANSNSAML